MTVKKFKDKNNGIHEIDINFLHLLPVGSVEISENEAKAISDEVAINSIDKVAQAKSELLQIDLNSIRAMREYITSKQDAPQILKDKESAAIEKRKALKNG